MVTVWKLKLLFGEWFSEIVIDNSSRCVYEFELEEEEKEGRYLWSFIFIWVLPFLEEIFFESFINPSKSSIIILIKDKIVKINLFFFSLSILYSWTKDKVKLYSFKPLFPLNPSFLNLFLSRFDTFPVFFFHNLQTYPKWFHCIRKSSKLP